MGDERDPGMETSRPPTHRKGAIWTERSLLALIVASLALTFNLMLAIHRQALTTLAPLDSESKPALTLHPPDVPKPAARSQVSAGDSGGKKPAIAQKSTVRPEDPPPPPEDPTIKALAGLTNATGMEIEEAQKSDRRALALETARQAAVAESGRWKRRELLVRQQITGLTERANQLEREAESLDAERDVLAHERDALKAALTKASHRTGFAVLPYKGPNGTWRRPIVLECTAGTVKLQPQGVSFSSMDLSPLVNPRSSPLIRAVARELLHIQAADTPDGSPAVPYLVFLVRPNGIRPYYEARTCLEALGIAFGYELIEQDLPVDIPDFDKLVTWDGSVPLDLPLQAAPARTTATVAVNSRSNGGSGNGASAGQQSDSQGNRPSFGAWPEGSDRAGNVTGGDQRNRDAASPEDFVWPTRGRQYAAGSRPTPGSDAADLNERSLNREGVGSLAAGAAGSPSGFPNDNGTGAFGNQRFSSPGNFSASDMPGSFPSRSGAPNRGTGSGAPAGGNESNFGSAGGNGSSFGSAGDTDSGSNSIARGSGRSAAQYGTPRSSGSESGVVPYVGTSNTFREGGAPSEPIGSSGSDGASPSPYNGRGSVPGQYNGGGLNSLPDLEPAGDSGSLQTSQSGSAISPGGLAEGSLAQGGQARSSGPGQVGIGVATRVGSGSPPSTPGSGAAIGTGSFVQSRDSATGGQPTQGGDASTEPDSSQSSSSLARPPGSVGAASGGGLGPNEGSPASDLGSGLSSAAPPSSVVSAPPSGVSAPAFGMPFSSNSSVSSTASPGGIPMSSSSSTSNSSSSSSLFGQDASSGSDSSDNDRIFAPAPKRQPPQGSIEVPFEIVIVCRQDDLLLHPGGYRLTTNAMREQGASRNGLLVQELLAMVRKRAIVDPLIRPKPKLRFLVETNGSETYWTARRQLLFSLPDWPMSLQVSGIHDSHVFTKETW